MALTLGDRIKDTTTTTGTGTLTLAASPPTGFQKFGSALSNGDTTWYSAVGRGTGEWEVGLGTYSSTGPELARTTIFSSSNAGAAVNFSAGVKDVFCTLPAVKSGSLNSPGTVTSVSVATANGVSGTVATATTTPAITVSLGAITPTSVNGITLSGSGSLANSGTSSLTGFTGSGSSSGTNTGDQTIPAGANPAGTVGLSAVNGSATTFLRSDGAPALSQAILPTWTAGHAWAQTAATGTPIASITVTGAAHTALTASTEYTDVNLNLARSIQFATGAKTTQRSARVQAPTLTAVGATTVTEASTLAVSGPPTASTNITITNPYSIVSEGGTVAVRKAGGTVGTQEVQILHDGTHGYVKSMANELRLYCAGVTLAMQISSSGIFHGVDPFSATSNLWAMDSAGWHLSSGQRTTWSPNASNAVTGIDTGLGRNAAGVVEANNGTNGTYRDILARGLRSNAVTFANAIASPVQGTFQAFTDSTTATWGATITGGGANKVMGHYNGTNWTVAAI